MIEVLLQLHLGDGRRVDINPATIVHLMGESPAGHKHMSGQVKCVITFSNGKFLSVVETCEDVRAKMGR